MSFFRNLFSITKFGLKILCTNIGMFNPYELNYSITYRCNSRCKICNIWKRKQHDELTLGEIKKLTKKLRFIQWVRLTGGEPFLRKDYVDIVKAFYQNLPNLVLLTTPTNGLTTDMILRDVKEVLKFFDKKYVISVSLDGPKKTHELIRGIPKSWDRSIETFMKLKQLEKHHKNFNVFFGYTISPFNLNKFEETLSQVQNVIPEVTANDFHVNIFQSSDVYYLNVNQKPGKDFFKKALKELDTVLRLRSRLSHPINMIENRYLKLGKKYLESEKNPIKCNIFNLSCFIDPQGNVYPCSIFNQKLGNLRDNDYDLKKILSSEKTKKMRDKILKGMCPQCWTPCEAHQLILSNWFKG